MGMNLKEKALTALKEIGLEIAVLAGKKVVTLATEIQQQKNISQTNEFTQKAE
jgi:hypothetical protein